MIFNGAAPARVLTSSPGKYAGEDNGRVLSLIYPVIVDFDKSIMKYPNITRYVGGASTDLVPDLQHPCSVAEEPDRATAYRRRRLKAAGKGVHACRHAPLDMGRIAR
jgi:hypothetical protein